VEAFLALDPELQLLYRVGRRTGILSGLADLESENLLAQVEDVCRRYGITADTVDEVSEEMMRRFI
jgi:hypothetical protein